MLRTFEVKNQTLIVRPSSSWLRCMIYLKHSIKNISDTFVQRVWCNFSFFIFFNGRFDNYLHFGKQKYLRTVDMFGFKLNGYTWKKKIVLGKSSEINCICSDFKTNTASYWNSSRCELFPKFPRLVTTIVLRLCRYEHYHILSRYNKTQ